MHAVLLLHRGCTPPTDWSGCQASHPPPNRPPCVCCCQALREALLREELATGRDMAANYTLYCTRRVCVGTRMGVGVNSCRGGKQ
jgi:hypothetical protein